jgi:hypothetical protein
MDTISFQTYLLAQRHDTACGPTGDRDAPYTGDPSCLQWCCGGHTGSFLLRWPMLSVRPVLLCGVCYFCCHLISLCACPACTEPGREAWPLGQYTSYTGVHQIARNEFIQIWYLIKPKAQITTCQINFDKAQPNWSTVSFWLQKWHSAFPVQPLLKRLSLAKVLVFYFLALTTGKSSSLKEFWFSTKNIYK